MPRNTFTEQVIEIIREIPEGRVATYGGIAALAGNPRAARQIVRILHTCSEQENLPWWRVVNREGRIALNPGYGYEEQEDLLLAEGVGFSNAGRVDLTRHLWSPDKDYLMPG
jgi:methylated-DNA-protein-cysteine methyltransferase-like protein